MSVFITRHAVAMVLSDSTILCVTADRTALTLGRISLAVVDKNIMDIRDQCNAQVKYSALYAIIFHSVRSLLTCKLDALAFIFLTEGGIHK